MVLNFEIRDNTVQCLNPEDLSSAVNIDYIKCHFVSKTKPWKDVQAIIAVFKSASYNISEEVLLDDAGCCYIPYTVYRRGGVIQLMLYGDNYTDITDGVDRKTTIMTNIIELYMSNNVIVPVVTPNKFDIFVAEYTKAKQDYSAYKDYLQGLLDDGAFNGVGIEDIQVDPDGYATFIMTDGTSHVSDFSLKGQKGDTGPQGLQGIQGEQGIKGDKGDKGDTGRGISQIYVSAYGVLYVFYDDGTVYTSRDSLIGPKGDKGDKGDPFYIVKTYSSTREMRDDYTGTDVQEGEYVAIDSDITDLDNGKIYIKGPSAYDFVVDLSGPKGDKGDTGDAFTYEDFTPEQLAGLVGPQGPKGDKGDKGDTGDAFTYEDFTPEQLAGLVGPQGPKGDKGDKGDTGATGSQGETGPAGYTPVRGTDYWTPTDRNAIKADVLSQIGASATNSIDYGTATTVTPSRSGWLTVVLATDTPSPSIPPVAGISQGGRLIAGGTGITYQNSLFTCSCYVRKGLQYTIDAYRSAIQSVTLY